MVHRTQRPIIALMPTRMKPVAFRALRKRFADEALCDVAGIVSVGARRTPSGLELDVVVDRSLAVEIPASFEGLPVSVRQGTRGTVALGFVR